MTDVDTHGGDVEVGLHAELLRPVHGGADVVAAPPPQRAQPRVAGHQQPRPGPAHTHNILLKCLQIFLSAYSSATGQYPLYSGWSASYLGTVPG